jgi:hypothetical protein
MTSIDISYAALEQLERNIDYCEAMEYYTFIHRLFDAFGRLISNIKTELLNFNKKFKRSELQFYHDSKRFAIANLVKTKYFDKDLMVPIPSGMKVPYIKAVDVINKLFNELDINNTIHELIEYLNTSSDKKSTANTIRKISKMTKLHLEVQLRSVFSNEKTIDVPLHTVISNFNEVLELDKKILDYETIFKQVPEFCEKITLIETLVDKIVTELEHKDHVDRNYIKSLHTLIKTAAVQLDSLGVILIEMSRVEHNFVLVLNKLVVNAEKL